MPILSDSELMARVQAAGFTGQDAVIAFAIAKAESGKNTQIVSKPNTDGSVDRGLFQINSKAWPTFSAWNDPAANAAFAHDVVYKQQGWRAWSAFNNKSYLQYVNDGVKAFAGNLGVSTVPTGSGGTANPGATNDPTSGGSNKFATIMSKDLWIRIGVGAVGGLMLITGFYLFGRDEAKGIVKTIAKDTVG